MATPSEPKSSISRKRGASELTESTDCCCERCAMMVGTILGLRALFHPDGYRLHKWPELKKSADRGCCCCVFITNRLRNMPKRWDDSSTLFFRSPFYGERYAAYSDSEFESVLEQQGSWSTPKSGFACLDLYIIPHIPILQSNATTSFFLYNGGDGHESHFVQRHAMLTDVAADFAFRKARLWLEDCQNNHVKCPGKKTSTLPSRVIDVGTGPNPSHIKLKVNNAPAKAPYTALSYCWGGAQQTTTTKSTLSVHIVSGVSYELLPRTIQDAVTTTRKLGIRYLWVDALCIIQDCAVDKAKEISKMGQIYKNATLTIAAASANTAHDGFLQPRPKIPSCEIPIYHNWREEYEREPNNRLSFEAWMKGKMPRRIWLTAHVKSSDADEPLYLRGWTLQERLLSPRMLLYGRKELTWQCQQDSSKSIGRTFYQRSTGCKRLPISIFVNKKLKRTERPSSTQIKKVWASIIEDYTRRHLSFIEDRLPALVGIAEQLQNVWGDYIAGFWRSCIVAHLGWRRAGRGNMMPPTELYIAPTWSWASFLGPVKVHTVNRADAEILDCAVDPLNSKIPLGQMRSGHVKIRAVAVNSRLARSKQEFPDFEITIDYNTTRLGDETRLLYILLGFEFEESWRDHKVGLILSANLDGTYSRIGQFRSSKSLDALPFEENDSCDRRTLTLV